MVPIPTPERVLSGTAIEPEQLAFVVTNVTTRTEIIEHLGEPNAIWVEADLFVYEWVMRRGLLLWAVGVGPAGGGVGAAGGAGAVPIPKTYVLLVQFDQCDRVQRCARLVRPMGTFYGDFLKQWVKVTAEASRPE